MKDKIFNRLIVFLIRKKFRLKNMIYISLMIAAYKKIIGGYGAYKPSKISLNFLMSKGCNITKSED